MRVIVGHEAISIERTSRAVCRICPSLRQTKRDTAFSRRLLLTFLAGLLISTTLGCRSISLESSSMADRMGARRSFVWWNLDSNTGQHQTQVIPRNVQLAGLPKSQLKEFMANYPPPIAESLEGHWLGVNSGVGLALFGTSQFVKRFESCSSADCTQGIGTNLTVHQVPLDQLACRGWKPRKDLTTAAPHTHGNFLIVCRETLELDYTLAKNPFFDPARFLVDELVQVDEGLLLGRANLQFFRWRIPVTYFALTRAP